MRYPANIAALICLGMWSALPGLGQERPAQSPLDDVPALDQSITCTETRIPLGDLLRRVSRETGGPLTASRQVADEPVAVAVKDLPARTLLRQLAVMLDFQWQRAGRDETPRYELGRNLASIRREAALRRALTEEVERRFQEELRQLQELAALPQERLEALTAEGEQRAREVAVLPPGEQARARNSPQERALRERASRAAQLWSPHSRALLKLLAEFSPEQWNLLRQGEPVAFSSAPRAGELPLPPGLLRTFHETEFRLRQPPGLGEPDPTGRRITLEEWERREQQARDGWQTAAGYQVLLWLDTERAEQELALYAGAYPLDPVGQPRSAGTGAYAYLEVKSGSWSSRQNEAEQERTPERTMSLEREPVLAAKKIFRPAEARGAEARYRTLPEYLPELAHLFGVPILSDAYTNSISLWQAGGPEPVAFHALLDRLTGVHHRWEYQDGIIQLRHRAWYLERPREVPLRLLRQWQSSCEQRGALHWKELVEAQKTLTVAQRMSMSELFPERNDLPTDFSANGTRYAPLLYETLTPQQRTRLRQGRPLAMAELTATQRRLFLGPLRATVRYNLVNRLPPVVIRDLYGATLTLRSERLLRTREVLPDGRVRYRTQTAPPGNSPARITAEGLQPHWVTRLRFNYQYGPERRSNEEVTVATLP